MTQATETEPDYTPYAHKAPTALQERFPEWLTSKTGYDPSAAKSKQEAFEAGVRLSVALRMDYQASPENREATEKERAARAAEVAARQAARQQAAPAAAPAAASEEAPEAPARGRGRRAAAAPPAPVAETPAPPEAPKPRGRRRGSAAPAAF